MTQSKNSTQITLMKTKRNLIQICLLLAVLMSVLTHEATAGVVTNNADSGPGSLRQTIAGAAAFSTITFATNLSGSTITLTNGQLLVSSNLTIDASALTGGIQIKGNGTSRVFYLTNGPTVVLTALTITNGAVSLDVGGGIYNNNGTLTLNQCTLSGNHASSGSGGGIFNLYGTLTLNRCTLSGNQATYGGAIENDLGALTVNQCTLAGNVGTSGSGIYNQGGNLALNQSTVAGNVAFLSGGGIYNYQGTTTLTNSIVAGNGSGSGADIVTDTGSTSVGGTNIVQYYAQINGGSFSGTSPVTNAPQLAPLGNYGGLRACLKKPEA